MYLIFIHVCMKHLADVIFVFLIFYVHNMDVVCYEGARGRMWERFKSTVPIKLSCCPSSL